MVERAAGNDPGVVTPAVTAAGEAPDDDDEPDDPNQPRKQSPAPPPGAAVDAPKPIRDRAAPGPASRKELVDGRDPRAAGRTAEGRCGSIDDLVDAGSREHYADAALYDYEYRRRRADVTFYRELAREHSSPILELGAGSGRVTIALSARDGHRVVAIDQSPAMLAGLRARVDALPKAVAARITIVRADPLRTFEVPGRFGLDDRYCVQRPRAPLHARGGRRVPRAGRRTAGRRGRIRVRRPAAGPGLAAPRSRRSAGRRPRFTDPTTKRPIFYSTNHDYDPVGQIALIRLYYEPVDGKGPTRIVKLSQRKFFPAELEALVAHAGFRVVQRYGDFQRRPLDAAAESRGPGRGADSLVGTAPVNAFLDGKNLFSDEDLGDFRSSSRNQLSTGCSPSRAPCPEIDLAISVEKMSKKKIFDEVFGSVCQTVRVAFAHPNNPREGLQIMGEKIAKLGIEA